MAEKRGEGTGEQPRLKTCKGGESARGGGDILRISKKETSLPVVNRKNPHRQGKSFKFTRRGGVSATHLKLGDLLGGQRIASVLAAGTHHGGLKGH